LGSIVSLFAFARSIGVEALDQLRQHPNDAQQKRLALRNPRLRYQCFGGERIEAGCAFHRVAARVVEELRALFSLTLSVALSGV
jgi:hypothetical protein